jgi:hypothetical protein
MSREIKLSLDFTAGAISPDGIKAIVKKVEDLEKLHANVAQVDLADTPIVVTGSTPYKVYAFTLTTTFATGVYAAVFVEEAPNVEGLS